jgi:hypothetical protein
MSDLENHAHESGKTAQIAFQCGVSAYWLATGDGDMVDGAQPVVRIVPDLDQALTVAWAIARYEYTGLPVGENSASFFAPTDRVTGYITLSSPPVSGQFLTPQFLSARFQIGSLSLELDALHCWSTPDSGGNEKSSEYRLT